MNKILRYYPDINIGLTKQEVKSRVNAGLVNVDKSVQSKSTKNIIYDNIFTLFNFINLILALAILTVGSYKNLMFIFVVICNSIIGIVQEIRAKKTVDKLNLISSSCAKVIRDSKLKNISVEKVVLDDIIVFSAGNQVITDCIIKSGKCEVNESLLTGEPNLIIKKPGDTLLSGSYLVGGNCIAQADKVGENNYSSIILKGSKYIKKTKSEIMISVNKIIKMVSLAIIPIGTLLFYRQLLASNFDYTSTIIKTSAALIGMIPEGLVLLTSTILAVGVLKLSKNRVLVQDIYSLETLARVDTLCLDKTGTITEGTFEVHDIIPATGFTRENISEALSNISSVLSDNNETFNAIKNKFFSGEKKYKSVEIIPFSSERKWSGAQFETVGTFIMGAGEMIFKENYYKIADNVKTYSENYRVLTIVHSDNGLEYGEIPKDIELMGFVLIKDKIRFNATKTLDFFKNQGVKLKVISGDSPYTISKIANRVNIDDSSDYIDVSSLKNDNEVKDAATKYTIFGRVTPIRKQIIVKALKDSGKTVAMVGDGVNDVLAMKEADCSVAMASGSDISRNVAHLVLLNSDFASMPKAVAEGRIAINNIQRSSTLFIVKTIYSFILSVLFMILPFSYPFTPIQLTLISTLTIGIPSFILALEPNREKIKGKLLSNILSESLPAALTVVLSLLTCVLMSSMFNFSYEKYSTLCVIITGIIGMFLIYKISLPLNLLRKGLLWNIAILFSLCTLRFNSVFSLEPFSLFNFFALIILIVTAAFFYEFISKLEIQKLFQKIKK